MWVSACRFPNSRSLRYVEANIIVCRLQDCASIAVKVGPESHSVTWNLPKDLLVHHSLFFSAALDGQFLESHSNSVSLPEDDPDTFKLFIQWLYLGSIPDHPPALCVQAWLLGDKLGCNAFCNSVISKLIYEFGSLGISPSIISMIYGQTSEGCLLRAWALDQFCWDSRERRLDGSSDDWAYLADSHVDFARDVLSRIVDGRLTGEIDPPPEYPVVYYKNE